METTLFCPFLQVCSLWSICVCCLLKDILEQQWHKCLVFVPHALPCQFNVTLMDTKFCNAYFLLILYTLQFSDVQYVVQGHDCAIT